jgi:hypothetical protein
MDEFYRCENFAYSSRREKFVNAFRHTRLVKFNCGPRKSVDSLRVEQNPLLARGLAVSGCGKTEEGFGKKEPQFST